MLAFEIKDMTCGHCVSVIAKAIETADPGARVQIDLSAHRVQIQEMSSDGARLSAAISAAGYTPTDAKGPAGDTAASRKRGCCCG